MTKSSLKEDEYMARWELERSKKLAEERMRTMAAEEKRRLCELHFMHCPKCGTRLFEIDYRGVTIDRCPSCEGIWLDKGELETMMKMDKPGLGSILDLFR